MIRNNHLQCNSIAECPTCQSVQYVQMDIDNTATILTCHQCGQAWRTGHGLTFIHYAAQIEYKYAMAHGLLKFMDATEDTFASFAKSSALLRRHGFYYNKESSIWELAS